MPRSHHDRNLHVEFYMGAVQSGPLSEAAGHPVFIDHPFVRTHIPGDPNNIIDTKVNETHKRRFPEEYQALMSGSATAVTGWRLSEWPILSKAQVKNFEFLNIHTVEQLAGLTDTQVQKIGMGGMDLRAKAKAALDAAKDGAAAAAQAAQAEHMASEIEQLKAQIAALGDEPRRPGRPARKESAEA